MATKTWIPTSGTGTWTQASWTTGAATSAFATGDDLVINSAVTVHNSAGTNLFTPRSLTISGANSLFQISNNTGVTRTVNLNNAATGGLILTAGSLTMANTGPHSLTLNTSNITIAGGALSTASTKGAATINVTQGGGAAGSGVVKLSAGVLSVTDAFTALNIGNAAGAGAGSTHISATGSLLVAGGAATLRAFKNTAGVFIQSGGSVAIVNTGTFAGGANTISSGTFSAGTVVNSGTVTVSGGTLIANGGGITNSGTMFISGAGKIGGGAGGMTNTGLVSGVGVLTGAINASTGTFIANGAGTLDVQGAVSAGAGVWRVNAGSTLEFDSTVGATTIDMAGTSGIGTLRLNDKKTTGSLGFSASITGLNVGVGLNNSAAADVIKCPSRNFLSY